MKPICDWVSYNTNADADFCFFSPGTCDGCFILPRITWMHYCRIQSEVGLYLPRRFSTGKKLNPKDLSVNNVYHSTQNLIIRFNLLKMRKYGNLNKIKDGKI